MINFKELIQKELNDSDLSVNQLCVQAKLQRDVVYRFMKPADDPRATTSLHSQTLEKILAFFGYDTISKSK